MVEREAFDGHALGEVAIVHMQDMQHWGCNYQFFKYHLTNEMSENSGRKPFKIS